MSLRSPEMLQEAKARRHAMELWVAEAEFERLQAWAARLMRRAERHQRAIEADAKRERIAIQRLEQYETVVAMRAAGHGWHASAFAAGLYGAGSAHNLVTTMTEKIRGVVS